jgi:hypothetical protein
MDFRRRNPASSAMAIAAGENPTSFKPVRVQVAALPLIACNNARRNEQYGGAVKSS